MWELVKQTTGYADMAGVWLGIILALPIFHTWYQVTVGKKRQHKKLLSEIQKNPGHRPGILIIDLLRGEKSVEASVENYRNRHDALNGVQHIFKITTKTESLTPEDTLWLSEELRKTAVEVLSAGVGTLHCFYGGPVVMTAFIGGEFSNTCQLVLYQRTRDKTDYECWGPLQKD